MPVSGTTAPCPECAAPSRTTGQSFCDACGAFLRWDTGSATAAAEQPDSWPLAGRRPALRRERRRWTVRAVVVAALVLVAAGGLLGGPRAARAVQDHFAERVAVRPTSWIASHSAAGHGPEAAFDTSSTTWWGTGYAGDSGGQHLQADFARPVDLLAVLVTPGTSERPGRAADQARPQEIDLVVTDSAGRSRTVRRTLDDGGAQRVGVRGRHTVSVRIVLRSAYGSGPDRQVAVAEVKFFGRSRA